VVDDAAADASRHAARRHSLHGKGPARNRCGRHALWRLARRRRRRQERTHVRGKIALPGARPAHRVAGAATGTGPERRTMSRGITREWLAHANAVLSLALVALYLAWWLASGGPLQILPLAALLAAVLPLLLLAPSLWQGRRFGGTLAGFILPFHFAFAVMELVA